MLLIINAGRAEKTIPSGMGRKGLLGELQKHRLRRMKHTQSTQVIINTSVSLVKKSV